MVLSEIKVTEEFRKEMDTWREPPRDKGLIEACSMNITLFAERMVGVRLYSWQIYSLLPIQELMNEADPVKRASAIRKFLDITSRQIGKSTKVAMLILWACVYNKFPGTLFNNTGAGVVSATDPQAKKLLNEVYKLIRLGDKNMMNKYRDEHGNPLFGKKFFTDLLDNAEANNTSTITFKAYDENVHGPFILKGSLSGSFIKSYPPTSVVLGETLTILVEDEAGKTDKISDEFHDDFASPTISSTNGMNILLSTPWTPSGFFYEACDPDDRHQEHDYIRTMFTCEAIKDENSAQYAYIQGEIAKLERAAKHDTVQRAYFCRFVKGEQTYFDPDAVRDTFTGEYQEMSTYKGPCDMGIDYGGQVTSRTVITISRYTETGDIERLYRRAYGVQQDLGLLDDIAELRKVFNVQRIIADDCPEGDFMNRTMLEKGWPVVLMNFRSEKVKKYGAFRAEVNRGKVRSFIDDELQVEMLAMEFSQGKKQSVLQHAPGYTDDLIDSFVMSAYFYVENEDDVRAYDYYASEEETPIEKKIRLRNEGRMV